MYEFIAIATSLCSVIALCRIASTLSELLKCHRAWLSCFYFNSRDSIKDGFDAAKCTEDQR